MSIEGVETKLRLCDTLITYGFYEIAIDILAKCFEKQPDHADLITMLGDTCFRAGYLQDAQLFYNKLLNVKPEYSSYERCYDLYEASEDLEDENNKNEIKRKFPLAKWTKGFVMV